MNDVQVTRLDFDTNPVKSDPPIEIAVSHLDALLTNQWLEKMVLFGIEESSGKAPVEISYESAAFVGNTAKVTVKAGAGRFLKASGTLVIEVSGAPGGKLQVQVVEIRALGMLPVESIVSPFIEKGIDKVTDIPGIEHSPTEARAVLVDPNVLLNWKDVPLRFASNGAWTISGATNGLNVSFAG